MFTRPATEKEAAGVAALKEQLPSTLLNDADQGYLTDTTYLRFLRARKGDVAKAAELLKKAIEWRNTAKPYEIAAEEVQAMVSHIRVVQGGHDKDGCPIFCMVCLDPTGLSREARQRFLTFLLEEMERKGYDRVTWVISWKHVTKENLKTEDSADNDNNRKHRKEAMQMLLDYYPERMNHVLLFYAPFLIKLMLPFMRMAIDSTTAGKVHNIGSSAKHFEKYLDLEQLPKMCDGNRPDEVLERYSDLPAASKAV